MDSGCNVTLMARSEVDGLMDGWIVRCKEKYLKRCGYLDGWLDTVDGWFD